MPCRNAPRSLPAAPRAPTPSSTSARPGWRTRWEVADGRARRAVPAQLDRPRRADARAATRRVRFRSTSTGATPKSNGSTSSTTPISSSCGAMPTSTPPPSTLRRRCAVAPERDFGPRSGDDRYVLYTGGTTGQPKGVVWRQEDIFFGGARRREPGRAADRRARPNRRVRRRQPRAATARVPPARRSRTGAVRLARARTARAREWSVVGARHVARRRQARALRPTRTST